MDRPPSTRHLLRLGQLCLALGWCVATAAQDTLPPAPAARAPALSGDAAVLSRFGEFLTQHPGIEQRLRDNPQVLGNPAFLQNHPQIARALSAHPEVKAALARNPRWLLHRALAAGSPTPVDPARIAEFDRYLDQHPAVAQALMQHPRLLQQPDFLNSHQELHEYVRPRHQAAEPKPKLKPLKPERRP